MAKEDGVVGGGGVHERAGGGVGGGGVGKELEEGAGRRSRCAVKGEEAVHAIRLMKVRG